MKNIYCFYRFLFSFALILSIHANAWTKPEIKPETINGPGSHLILPGIAGKPAGISTFCSPAGSAIYTTAGAAFATDYIWEINPVEAGTITGTGLTSAVDWNTAFSGIAMITVTGVNSDGEGNVSPVLLVTINPTPIVIQLPDISVCPGSMVSSPPFSSNVSGTIYSWTNSNASIGLASTGSGNLASFNAPANPTPSDFLGNISVIGSINGCNSTAMLFRIRIHPTPQTSIIIGSATECLSQNDLFQVNYHANSIYTWNFPGSVTVLSGGGSSQGGTDYDNFCQLLFNSVGNQTISVSEMNMITGCIGVINSKTISVISNPAKPVITGPATICSNATAVLFSTIMHAGSAFDWKVPASSNIIGDPSLNTISVNFGNTPGFIVAKEISLQGCIGDADSIPISLEQRVNAGLINGNQAICGLTPPSAITQFQAASGGNGSYLFQWKYSTGTNGPWSNISGASASAYTPPPLSSNTYYKRFVTSGVCPADTSNRVDILLTGFAPGSAGAITGQNSVCTGDQKTYSITPVDSATSYSWTLPSGATIIGPSTNNSVVILFTTPGAGSITVSPVNHCGNGPSSNLTVTVNPIPVVNAQANISVCPGQSITPLAFTANTGGGETYIWTNSNIAIGISASGAGNIASYIAPGNNSGSVISSTISVSAVKNGCISAPSPFSISIKPVPVINAISNLTVCPQTTIAPPAFQSNTSGETYIWTNSNLAIGLAATGSGSIPAYTAPSNLTGFPFTGSISVIAILNSCVSISRVFSISIKSTPALVTSPPASQIICNNSSSNIVLTSPAVPVDSVRFDYSSSASGGISGSSVASNLLNGAIINDYLHNPGNVPQTVTYSITPRILGCSGNPQNVTVTVNPTPVVIPSTFAQAICSNTQTNITLASSTMPAGAVRFNYTVAATGGLTGFTSPVNNLTNNSIITDLLMNSTNSVQTATYTITPVAGGCIGTPVSVVVSVNPTPVLIPSVPNQTICDGTHPNIVLNSPTLPSVGVSFDYNVISTGSVFGYLTPVTGLPTGSVIDDTLKNFTSSAQNITYQLTPHAAGCTGSTVNVTVRLNPTPVINSPLPNKETCSGSLTSLDIRTINTPQDSVYFSYSAILNGSLAGSVAHSNVRVGSSGYTIAENLVNFANSKLRAVYNATPKMYGCIGASITLIDSVQPVPQVSSSTLRQEICDNSSTNFTLTTSTIPASCVTFGYTASATGGKLTGFANFSNGLLNNSTITNTVFNLGSKPDSVTYIITPSSSLCNGIPITVRVVVNPTPVVSLSSLNSTICSGSLTNIKLTTATLPSAGIRFDYSVDNSGNGIYGYASPVNNLINNAIIASNLHNDSSTIKNITYNITPRSLSGCIGITRQAIVGVNPFPVIDAGHDVTICSDGSSFLNASAGGSLTSVHWTGGDGSFSNSTSPSTIYYPNPLSEAGKTIVLHINTQDASGICPAISDSILLNILKKPSVLQDIPASICENLNIPVSAAAAGHYNKVTWTAEASSASGGKFNDSTLLNTFYLPAPGESGITTFKITLSDTLGYCGNVSGTANVTIYPKPILSLVCNAVNDTFEEGKSVTFTASGALLYQFFVKGESKSGPGTASLFNYLPSDSDEIWVTGVSAHGCSNNSDTIFLTEKATTNLPAVPGNISGVTEVCRREDSIVYSVPEVAFASSYIWDLPAGATGFSNSNQITITYDSSSVSGNITVKGHNSYGDGVISSLFVTVDSLPSAAGTIIGNQTICQGQNSVAYIVPEIPGASSYSWSLPEGVTGTATGNSIIADYTLSSVSGRISVSARNKCGWGIPSNLAIVVNAKPPAPIISITEISLQSNVITGNQWYNLDGVLSGETDQYFTPLVSGKYFTIVNLNGCYSDPSDTFDIVISGIKHTDLLQGVKIFPNPVQDELFLQFDGNNIKTNFKLLNSIGETIFEGSFFENMKIDMSAYPNGIYIVKIDSKNSSLIKKIVKTNK